MIKKNYIIIGLILASALVLLSAQKTEKFNPTKQTEIITIGGVRGDEIDPGPIETECQKDLNTYINGLYFKNKGFTECILINSKVGFGEKECPDGFSPQGCAICNLECK